MCGRFTTKTTWADLVGLYRLTMDAPPHNMPPRYNICSTDPGAKQQKPWGFHKYKFVVM
jgi:putative SOS response-associated peptidase YedK